MYVWALWLRCEFSVVKREGMQKFVLAISVDSRDLL